MKKNKSYKTKMIAEEEQLVGFTVETEEGMSR